MSAAASAPPVTVAIANRQRRQRVNVRLLRQIALAVFADLKIEAAELGVTLVGARQMARVNWDFLQHEGSTDVITFDHSDPSLSNKATPRRLHGELFICVDDAVKQARQFRTTWQSELVRYVVHGILHLSGYDDLKPDLRRIMKREETRLVRRLTAAFPVSKL